MKHPQIQRKQQIIRNNIDLSRAIAKHKTGNYDKPTSSSSGSNVAFSNPRSDQISESAKTMNGHLIVKWLVAVVFLCICATAALFLHEEQFIADFRTEEAYQRAGAEMKSIFDEMIARDPSKRHIPVSPPYIPSEKANFANSLLRNPLNERFLRAEYYYFDFKYGIGKIGDQLPLCIVAPGRNLLKHSKYERFIDSIERQNYSNYQLVYIDDASDDGSPQKMKQYVESIQGGKLKQNGRLRIVENQERVYALQNRDNGFRNYCSESSIILDVDADDAFIGSQAFKFVNAVYHDEDVWMCNSVFIFDRKKYGQAVTGPTGGVPRTVLEANSYRTSELWMTSELRSFRARLYRKIDPNDFKDAQGHYYRWASDSFIMYPLIELAGPKHYRHLYEVAYFYDWIFNWRNLYERRHFGDIARMQTPYLPLPSLDALPAKIQGYVVPERLRVKYEEDEKKAREDAALHNRTISWQLVMPIQILR